MRIKIDEFIYSINDDNTVNIIGKSSYSEIVIPRTIKYEAKEYIVRGISQESFASVEFIKLNFAPDSKLTTIEENAFLDSSIESLTIPASVTNLKDGWCCSTQKLNEIKVDSNNPKYKMYDDKLLIGKSNLEEEKYDVLVFCCRDVEKITIPNFIEIISPYAFDSCKRLQQIEFQSNSKLRIIGEFCFCDCKIRHISIPPHATTISEFAFYRCNFLQKVEIALNSELEIIENDVFYDSSIESLTIPASVTNLKDGWCSSTSKLKEVKVDPKNPKYMSYNDMAIFGKSNIEKENNDFPNILVFCARNVDKITIPNFIEIISPYAFDSCKELEKVEFQSNSKLRIIGSNSFANSSLRSITIPSHIKIIDKSTFINCYKLQEIDIPYNSELETISKFSFLATSFSSLYIPSKVTNLEDKWCSGTPFLNEIKVDSNNPKYKMYDDKLLIGKSNLEEEKYDVLVFCCRDVEKITIPNFIEIISPYAFDSCKRLQQIEFQSNSKLRIIGNNSFQNSTICSITIPPHVTKICECAFMKCKNLQKVEFLPDSKLEIIENHSFKKSSIIGITIPSSVTQIGQKSFYKCEKLKHVEFELNSKLQLIDDYAFAMTKINSIKIPSHVTRIGKYCFSKIFTLTSVEIPKDSELQIIDDLAFQQTEIEQIFIPSNITRISFRCFYWCMRLSKIEFESKSKLQIIDEQAFYGCGIDEIDFPSQITLINSDAFSDCNKLKNVVIPEQLKRINNGVFRSTLIDSISIPSSVIEIGDYALGTKSLKKVEIQNDANLNTIGKYAFYNSLIESLTIPASVTNLKDGWCCSTQKLNEIKVDSNNPKYKMYDDKLLIGKSYLEEEKYDVLVFCFRDVEKITIPNFIEIISPYAFDSCKRLQQIEFQSNSKLRIIGMAAFRETLIECITIPPHVTLIDNEAFDRCQNLKQFDFPKDSELQTLNGYIFSYSLIEKLSIPSKVTNIRYNCFSSMPKLIDIKIDENNSMYKIYNNQMIIGKSNIKNENYNVLVFAFSQKVIIPKFIEIIKPHSFINRSRNRQIQIVEFEKDSKLRVIDENAFSSSIIEHISIPKSVEQIQRLAFTPCQYLKSVDIPNDSKLQIIEKKAFMYSKITSISYPSHINFVSKFAFEKCMKLQIIEINEYSKEMDIDFNVDNYPQNMILMVSYKTIIQ